MPEAELDGFVERLARNIAALAPGVIAATKTAIDANFTDPLPALPEQNRQLGITFDRPAAGDLTRKAMRNGAQTREGEKTLEEILLDQRR